MVIYNRKMLESFGNVLVLFLVTVQLSSAANILIFPFPQYSHTAGAANVGEVLQEQGHNVAIAIPPHMKTKVAHNELKIILYHSLGDYETATNKLFNVTLYGFFHRKRYQGGLKEMVLKVSDQILTDERLYQDIRAFMPDLLILDSGVPSRMLSMIACKVDVPFIFIGETIQNQFARAPLLPSVVPGILLDATDQMIFWQRLSNTFIELMSYYYVPFSLGDSMNRYCPEKPDITTIHELQAKALLWIEIHDGILEYNKPIMPNIKQVSNLLPRTRKALPAEYQSFMDNAKEGVVIVSFGSVITSLPHEIIEKMLAAFKQTKYFFVMRKTAVSNFSASEKILLTEWMPQLELLCHKNTRLFITHCGANGQKEAVYAGVPMIGLPLINDQPHNAARIVGKGFGLRLDIRNFTADDLTSAIEEAIKNPEYKARTEKASAIIRAAKAAPVEEAAFWINHILTFGGDHLRSFGQDIPLWKYLGLDILALCFFIWHVFIFILISMLYRLSYYCGGRKNKVKDD